MYGDSFLGQALKTVPRSNAENRRKVINFGRLKTFPGLYTSYWFERSALGPDPEVPKTGSSVTRWLPFSAFFSGVRQSGEISRGLRDGP